MEEWIIGYNNFGIDDGAESKFGTHKELIVLNIFKYKYCVNSHVTILLNIGNYVTNWSVAGLKIEMEQ